jgi:hypothetical protein
MYAYRMKRSAEVGTRDGQRASGIFKEMHVFDEIG